jgi:hypothetical protein
MAPPNGVSLEAILLSLVAAVERATGASSDTAQEIRDLAARLEREIEERDERLEQRLSFTISAAKDEIIRAATASIREANRNRTPRPPTPAPIDQEALEKKITDLVTNAVAAAVPTAVDARLPAVKEAEAKAKIAGEEGRTLAAWVYSLKANPFLSLALLILVTMFAQWMGMGYVVAYYVPAAAERAAEEETAKEKVNADVKREVGDEPPTGENDDAPDP